MLTEYEKKHKREILAAWDREVFAFRKHGNVVLGSWSLSLWFPSESYVKVLLNPPQTARGL